MRPANLLVPRPKWLPCSRGGFHIDPCAPSPCARRPRLFDHDPASPGYDPHEWHNVADAHPDVVAELRSLLPSLEAPEGAITASLAEEHG